ncbi:MAG: DUF4350 domain-containing protein [Gemmatimonadales bacterium]
MRRTELAVILALAVATVLAAVAGSRASPDESISDPRRSTEVHGPNGASAFARALEMLGVPVEKRRRPLFGIADSLSGGGDEWVALLDVRYPPTGAEAEELVSLVERGGALFLSGRNGVESCFGFDVVRVRGDDATVGSSSPELSLPDVRFVLRRAGQSDAPIDEERPALGAEEPVCARARIVGDVPLLSTEDGRLVAARLETAGGGRVILLADSRFISNRALREGDAGTLVLGWLLAEHPSRVIADEYHQGLGVGGSVFAAAWRWMRAAPPGWMLLQLVFAALVGLAALAVRFGPALTVTESRRRSPLEHVDALAAGLQRSEGWDTAVGLIVNGLRRRLSQSGRDRRRAGSDAREWLESLAVATRSPEAQGAIRRLDWLLRERGGDQRVLSAAQAVEDVWKALGRTSESSRY